MEQNILINQRSYAYTKLTNMGYGGHFYIGRGSDRVLEHPPSLKEGTMKKENISWRFDKERIWDFDKKVVQGFFDKWSVPYTGKPMDVQDSSHGQAFIAGWLARGDYDA